MTSPTTIRRERSTPEDDPVSAERWRRLQDERRFRLQQIADLEAETPVSQRHESVNRLLRVSAGIALAEIDAALARLAEGHYGVCVRCGGEIDPQRLAILPMAPLCMNCHYNEQNCRLAAVLRSERE
jgi:DnaK suppressor protein